jgi:predicted transcriptional regulator
MPMFREFDNGPLFRNPIAHANDPSTSHEAARRIDELGTRSRHADVIYREIERRPLQTAPEIAHECGLEEYQVRRRLTDLKDAGRIRGSNMRKCRIKGTNMITWEIKNAARARGVRRAPQGDGPGE